jgi:pantoate--beta-alanine ligase
MKILYSNNDLNEALNGVTKLGFVPTMGSLHKGHISLIKKSKTKCSKTLVSIFINPTQFNNIKDYIKYPKNIKKDLSILKKLNVNFVFIPNKNDIYNSKRKNKIKIHLNDKILCAKFRKGHFEGVIDIMDRLTNLIKPKNIFMGEKDFQQLHLVKRYIEKKYKVFVIGCKTIRDINKLALSSRNLFLSKKELLLAGNLAKTLILFKKNLIKKREKINLIDRKKNYLAKFYNISIEYLELRHQNSLKKTNQIKNARLFIAYKLNNIRLIDNF